MYNKHCIKGSGFTSHFIPILPTGLKEVKEQASIPQQEQGKMGFSDSPTPGKSECVSCSVQLCPTLSPHGLYLARFLYPWNFLGKNIGRKEEYSS